jgi:hypothetical protein
VRAGHRRRCWWRLGTRRREIAVGGVRRRRGPRMGRLVIGAARAAHRPAGKRVRLEETLARSAAHGRETTPARCVGDTSAGHEGRR